MATQPFAYEFQLNPMTGASFAVQDASGSLPGLQAHGPKVLVHGIDDAKKVLDEAGDSFQVGSGNKAQIFTYVGTAADETGKILGIVGEKDGSRFLFTDHGDLDPTQVLKLVPPDDGGEWSLLKRGPLCFMPGTRIATPSGEVAIEDLAIGDLVLTTAGAAAPVRWIGRQTVVLGSGDPLRTTPIRIRAGALGGGLPTRDLRVSPDHALLVDGVLVQAAALVNGTSILRDTDVPASFTYLHVELDDHALLLAEGAPAESFIDNVDRAAFDNWAEREALLGAPAPMTEMALPRVRSARQLPAATRTRLLSVAATLPGANLAKAA
jgi:hypothetical protein